MILGRPTNLWTGLVTSVIGLVTILAIQAGFDPVTVGTTAGAVTLLAGAVISLVANQPPTLNPGDAYTVLTPTGAPNVSKVANTNVTPIPPNAGVVDKP